MEAQVVPTTPLVTILGPLVLQRKVNITSQHSTLSRPQAVSKGAGGTRPHPSIRASAPLRRRFSTTQGASVHRQTNFAL